MTRDELALPALIVDVDAMEASLARMAGFVRDGAHDEILRHLCDSANETKTIFPDTQLRLRFQVGWGLFLDFTRSEIRLGRQKCLRHSGRHNLRHSSTKLKVATRVIANVPMRNCYGAIARKLPVGVSLVGAWRRAQVAGALQ
jgi:hypothetical protein